MTLYCDDGAKTREKVAIGADMGSHLQSPTGTPGGWVRRQESESKSISGADAGVVAARPDLTTSAKTGAAAVFPAAVLAVALLSSPALPQDPPSPSTDNPALADPDPLVRMRAVDGLTDQQELLQVARMDQDAEVRLHAVAKIQDAASLSRIAFTDPSLRVELLATDRIGDERLLV